jgi:pimeloyl-ACP methyl ester carboxylesterase
MHGSGTLFVPFVRALPADIKPVIVSYPSYQPLDYKGHLEIVMAALPEDGPFVLLGESFSGPLALMAAARRPKGLCGVILCATFASWPLLISPSIARMIVALGVFRLKSTRLFLRIILGGRASEELNALFSEALSCTTPEVLAARARAVMEMDCREALRECPVPLLAMVADHDRIIAWNYTKVMSSIRPDMEIVHLNAPHLILQCVPVEVAGAILGFIKYTTAKANHENCDRTS